MSEPRVVLGITGGIAAYKAAAITSQLAQHGCEVHTVLTPSAREFVGPAALTALSGRPVVETMFGDGRFPLGAHIELADADVLCIAPATANFLAKAAGGVADDLLTTLYLAFQGRVICAPAMNSQMWEHVAVQRNVAQVRADGVEILEPGSGWLSCRTDGVGRMAEPESIVAAIRQQ